LFGTQENANLDALRKRYGRSFIAGVFSAVTGTGVAEMHQPLLDHEGELNTKRANATAILIEALADWVITIFNLTIGNLNFDILVFSMSGVLIGAQLGAILSPHLPDRLLKTIFGVSVLSIGVIYVVTAGLSFVKA